LDELRRKCSTYGSTKYPWEEAEDLTRAAVRDVEVMASFRGGEDGFGRGW